MGVLRSAKGAGASGFTVTLKTDDADGVVIHLTSYAANAEPAITDTTRGQTLNHRTAVLTNTFIRSRFHDIISGFTGDPSHVFTLASGTNFAVMEVFAVKGFAPSAFDQEGSGSQSVGATSQSLSGAITPSAGNSLIFAGIGSATEPSAGAPPFTVGSGFTIDASGATGTLTSPGVYFAGACAYLLQAVAAPVNPLFSWAGTNSESAIAAVSYKLAAAATQTAKNVFASTAVAPSLSRQTGHAVAAKSFPVAAFVRQTAHAIAAMALPIPSLTRGTPQPVTIILDTSSGASWTVPSNWNSAANVIGTLAAGGNGAPGVVNTNGGGGGGGGGYSESPNVVLTPGAVIPIHVSAGGDGSAGWTGFGSSSSLAASTVGANAGANAPGMVSGAGGSATGAQGTTKNAGGSSGNASASTSRPGAGGGGAAGRSGAGKAGGSGSGGGTTSGGQGGGGSNGALSTVGAAAGGSTGAVGGNGTAGTGGGTGGVTNANGSNGTAGTGGGGGGCGASTGTVKSGGNGVHDASFDATHGSSGGGGSGGTASTGFAAGNGGTASYGGGGGGGGTTPTTGTAGTGGAGGPGLIFIQYTPASAASYTQPVMAAVLAVAALPKTAARGVIVMATTGPVASLGRGPRKLIGAVVNAIASVTRPAVVLTNKNIFAMVSPGASVTGLKAKLQNVVAICAPVATVAKGLAQKLSAVVNAVVSPVASIFAQLRTGAFHIPRFLASVASQRAIKPKDKP